MRRKASDIYFDGEYNYANIVVHPDGTHEVTIITKSGAIARLRLRFPPRRPPEVVEDSVVEV